MNPQELGEVFAVKREKLHMTQKQVADLIGVSRGYIGRIERGKMPSDDVFLKLVFVLQLALEEILPMSEIRAAEPGLAEMFDAVSPQMKIIGENLAPEQMLELLNAQAKHEVMIDSIIGAAAHVNIETGPNGWGKLTKGDRKLVQEIVNRLLKTKRYEEV
ncbi:MAG: helix-turn-helix transcriptional regulator [Coriobacteriia bacterium]|nr:helix-turn-helix transcriptional regulator [Coriobacteriia bacterium]